MKKTIVIASMLLCSAAHAQSKAWPEKPGQWVYTEHVDKMYGDKTRTGSIKSETKIQLKPPYSGKNAAWLHVTSLPNGDYGVSISLEKGQILCPINCEVVARFDGSSVMSFKARSPADLSTSSVHINRGGNFFDWMAKSKEMMVQVLLYQHGEQVLEFKLQEPPALD